MLSVSGDGATAPVYEVGVIDKEKDANVDNLLAFCPMCQATYSLDNNKKLCKELIGVKKILVARNQSMRRLDGMPLEKGIVGVMSKIKKLKEKDLLDPSLDPKDVRKNGIRMTILSCTRRSRTMCRPTTSR